MGLQFPETLARCYDMNKRSSARAFLVQCLEEKRYDSYVGWENEAEGIVKFKNIEAFAVIWSCWKHCAIETYWPGQISVQVRIDCFMDELNFDECLEELSTNRIRLLTTSNNTFENSKHDSFRDLMLRLLLEKQFSDAIRWINKKDLEFEVLDIDTIWENWMLTNPQSTNTKSTSTKESILDEYCKQNILEPVSKNEEAKYRFIGISLDCLNPEF